MFQQIQILVHKLYLMQLSAATRYLMTEAQLIHSDYDSHTLPGQYDGSHLQHHKLNSCTLLPDVYGYIHNLHD
jgi:hypothetical protein